MYAGGYQPKFYAYNGPGPYSCFFCSESVIAPWDSIAPHGLSSLALVIHHVNCDEDDHSVDNLVAVHRGCHKRWHNQNTLKRNGPAISASLRASWARRKASGTIATTRGDE